MHLRAKDIVERHNQSVNESQTRDASPYVQQLMEQIPSVSQAIGSAMGQVGQVLSIADAARDAISSAIQTSQSIGVESDAIIDNLNAMQQSDPSHSIVTLSDHQSGVQQACNMLMNIISSLNTAQTNCNKLNQLASRQFL